MTKRMIPSLLRECIRSSDPWIDDRLWKNCKLPKKVFDPHLLGRRLSIGIKAMPGRKGYGSGHDKDCGWAIRDPDGLKLVELLGSDAANYTPFYEVPKPKRVFAQAPSLPTIEVHLVTYNEEEILPYTLRHYKTFASRIVVHDGGSTDRTKAICEEAGAEVEHWETGGQINDELLRILKETCWAGTDAKWVIVADADEFVYFPKGAEATLRAYDMHQFPVVRCHGFEMESPVYPTTQGQIYDEVNHGSPDDRWYGKPILISPARVGSIHYAHGAHECVVTLKNGRRIPNPRVPHNPPTFLLHYHHLGPVERIGARYDGNKSRFSENQKKHGWGWGGDGFCHATDKRNAILKNRRKII